VGLLAVSSSIVRTALACRCYGFQTGDDLEIAEEAFRRAVGLVHTPWDVRSLLIPDLLVAPLVWLLHAAGMQDALDLAIAARAPFVALSAANIVLLFLLGRRWYGDAVALLASALYAVHWIPLVYGSSLYPRTVAVTCILAAVLLLSGTRSGGRAVVAGLLVALAVTARYSEAIYFLSLCLFLDDEDPRERRRMLTALTGGFVLGIAVLAGLYDRITWGRWFGSLIAFAELTFIRRDSSSIVVAQPAWWYLTNLPHWLPLTLLPGLVISARATEWRRVLAFVVLPLLALSAIFHKELRYLQVVVPFALLLGTHGLVIWWRRPERRLLAVALLALAFPLALTGIGDAAKRSTNAVNAARWIASQHPSAVALSQAWAYGGRLFLGNDVAVTDVGVPPNLALLQQSPPELSVLGVYSSDVDDRLRTACAARGLSGTATFRGRGGRSVTLFLRPFSAVPRGGAPIRAAR